MLSQVYNITQSATTQSWKLGDKLGHPFEDFITSFVGQTLNEDGYLLNEQVEIHQTPGSNDGGKDIIIISQVAIHDLFGFEFLLNGKASQKIFVECKSSDNGAIDYNKLCGGIQRAQEQEVDVYIVVTNTTLVPYCYYQLQEIAAQHKIRFELVDQYILSRELKRKGKFIGDINPLAQETDKEIKYQVLSNCDATQQNCEIYFLIRNYSKHNLSLQISLATNWNWESDNDYVPISLGLHESTCERIRITRSYYDGQDSLQLTLQDENEETVINLKGVCWDSSFLPPLCGEAHQNMVRDMRDNILKASELKIFFVHGETGVGKTRVIKQLCLDLSKTATHCENYSCSSRKMEPLKAIKEFCIKKNWLSAGKPSNTLSEVISQIQTPYKKHVFIIDDIHNAPDGFYDEIKQIAQQLIKQPIIIILVGRDDYISSKNSYINFLSYAENHKTQICDYPLHPLKPEESNGLIRSILSDVPEYALEKIFKLSNNIPLFIVQFTEYLLDLNLAHIVNRTSVHLKNYEKFSQRNYIPNRVEEIYKKRFEYIKKLPRGSEIQEILIGLSFFGEEFSDKLVITWGDGDLLNYLFQRSFLVYSNNENIRFAHESMYLYFRHMLFTSPKLKKRIAKKIIEEKGLHWDSLDILEQARLLLWIGKIKDAERKFSTVYSQINAFSNFSSMIINPEIDNYLYDIYECQKCKSPFPENFIEKLFQCKAYISLHYSSPAAAIEVCNFAEREITTSKEFCPGEAFKYVLKELKAHSYLNMGLYQKGYSLLQELLAMNLSHSDILTQETCFDLYDRLASIYLKYNQKALALEFNDLSKKIAETQNDFHLLALSSITKAKILFLNDFIDSKTELELASQYLSSKPDPRILCHNNVTQIISDFRTAYQPTYKNINIDFTKEAKKLLDDALQNNYANSILRILLFLATLAYLEKQYDIAEQYIDKGIDSCVKYGYGTYTWHFYNLRAILGISTKRNRNIVQRSFETMYRIMRQQNLLFLGNCDFTFENMIALTNIAKFYKNNEKEYYRKLSRISTLNFSQPCDYNCEKETCQYVCEDQTQLYIKEKEHILKKQILFVGDTDYNLLDPETNFFFLLS